MSNKPTRLPGDYAALLVEIKERVRSAQLAAFRAVNKELVGLYWDIGRMIVDRQAGETWGKAIVQQLAGDLRQEFPGVGGFSSSNLWRMKALYETYHASEKLAPLVREIGWSHNLGVPGRYSEPIQHAGSGTRFTGDTGRPSEKRMALPHLSRATTELAA